MIRHNLSVLRWTYHYRGILLAPPLLLALLSTFHETESFLIWPVGITMILLGITIRVCAQQHIHHRLKARRDLTTTGPYSIIRNPLYVANTVLCLGMIVLSEVLWLLPVILAYCCVLYSIVVRYEEKELLKEYGEAYHRYLAEVPRWLPKTLHSLGRNLVTSYLFHAMAAESFCLLLPIPYFIKEILA